MPLLNLDCAKLVVRELIVLENARIEAAAFCAAVLVLGVVDNRAGTGAAATACPAGAFFSLLSFQHDMAI